MKKLFLNSWLHLLVLFALLSAMLYVREKDYEWVKAMRYIAFDNYNIIAPRESNDQVIIADIDETSLHNDKLGQWPWPRDDISQLVKSLKEMGAKAIVFDIVFAEKDRTSPNSFIKKLSKSELSPAISKALISLPDHDTILADEIKKANNVVTGFVWSSDFNATRQTPILSKPIIIAKGMENFRTGLMTAPGVTTNLPLLETAAAGNGSFGQHPDIDGIIRRVPLLFSVRLIQKNMLEMFPSLAIEALRIADDPKTPSKVRAYKDSEMKAFSFPYLLKRGMHEIPMDQDANFYIHYSKYEAEKYIPAWKIIESKISPSFIRDKIVLIGTSAAGLKDVRSTPLNLYIPGVEVHRNIIEQIIDGRYLLRPQTMKAAEFLFTALIGILLIFFAPFINALLLCLFTVTLIISLHLLSFNSFISYGILIDPIYPSITISLVFILSSMLTYIRTEVERRAVKQAFSLYISPDYMKELADSPQKLKLGGELREISVMFSDIRGFTQISENLNPNELIKLINDFLTPMSDKIMANRGTIDKYIGDAIMAFWNAPLDDTEHERNACLAALAMKEALLPINNQLEVQAKISGNNEPLLLRAGIGINSGLASVGNMGSRQRFAYSVLGDTVNLASRLEGQTKIYGVDIIIGENTQANIPDFQTLELDLLQVKGKTVPVKAYALLGIKSDETFEVLKHTHVKMLAAYRAQNWNAAQELVNECLSMKHDGMNKYYTMMYSRISEIKTIQLPKDWDGVYNNFNKN